jgi:hypothetical protein
MPKGVLEKLDYYMPRFFDNVISTKGSIGLRSGVFSISLRVFGGKAVYT